MRGGGSPSKSAQSNLVADTGSASNNTTDESAADKKIAKLMKENAETNAKLDRLDHLEKVVMEIAPETFQMDDAPIRVRTLEVGANPEGTYIFII